MVSRKPLSGSELASRTPTSCRWALASKRPGCSAQLADARPRLGRLGSVSLLSRTRGASAAGRRCPHVRRLRAHLRGPRPAPPSAPPRRTSLAAAPRGGAGAAWCLISDAVSLLCSVVLDQKRSQSCGPHGGDRGRRRGRQWGRALRPGAHLVSPLDCCRERQWRRDSPQTTTPGGTFWGWPPGRRASWTPRAWKRSVSRAELGAWGQRLQAAATGVAGGSRG